MTVVAISSGRTAWLAAALMVGIVAFTPRVSRAHQEGGVPQTAAQQKCTNAANASWAKGGKAVQKNIDTCLKNYGNAQPLTSNPAITTLEQCVHADPNGKLLKEKTKTSGVFD